MKKIILLILALGIFSALYANPSEEEKIKEVITKSYVLGIHNRGSLEDVANGFHPDFEMISVREGVVSKLSIATWIENMKTSREKNPNQVIEKTDVNFLIVDVTGNAASVKLELIRGEKVIFTDYMFLYKFGEDWKIVSKIYYRH